MSETLQVLSVIIGGIGWSVVLTVLSLWVKQSNKITEVTTEMKNIKEELKEERRLREECENKHGKKD